MTRGEIVSAARFVAFGLPAAGKRGILALFVIPSAARNLLFANSVGVQLRKTMFPLTMVATGPPRKLQPSKGELWLFDQPSAAR